MWVQYSAAVVHESNKAETRNCKGPLYSVGLPVLDLNRSNLALEIIAVVHAEDEDGNNSMIGTVALERDSGREQAIGRVAKSRSSSFTSIHVVEVSRLPQVLPLFSPM